MIDRAVDTDTIAAIATPLGRGGIGIIKISGSLSKPILLRLFQPTRNTAPETHRLVHGHIVHPDTGQVVDEVLASWMEGPHSYTGEDVVEINAHGGPVVTQAILELVLAAGSRLATAGEFTRRAFCNGRMDLTQAEAVADLIHAKTDRAARAATRQLDGHLGSTILSFKNRLLAIQAHITARIDFPEDVDSSSEESMQLFKTLSEDILGPLEQLVRRYHEGEILREGLRLAVVGKPNVGKSSLMNRLLERDRVIVADQPGTTRDSVEEMLNLKGLPVVLTDTAGLRSTDDPVEQIGMDRTRAVIADADLVILMVEAGAPLGAEDLDIFHLMEPASTVMVRNKVDLTDNTQIPPVPETPDAIPSVSISAKFGQGIEQLVDIIFNAAIPEDAILAEGDGLPNLRQKIGLEKAVERVGSAVNLIRTEQADELTALEISEGIAYLDGVLGNEVPEDVLDLVFANFCIGK